MPTELHFVNADQGNMTLMLLDDGTKVLYDCNVTNSNYSATLGYLASVIGWDSPIDIFVNSHRDADHMRGIKEVHEFFPIQKIWDSGVTGNATTSPEYLDYMDLRRRVGFIEITPRKKWTYGKSVLRVMNSKNEHLKDEPNAQSIVIKVQHCDESNRYISGVMLPGDTDAVVWKESITSTYSMDDLKSDILLASHHGSISFFDDPRDTKSYYTAHIDSIDPAMTIISVGNNSHGHPDEKALKFYESYSRGTNKGNKIKRTDQHGNIKLVLNDGGGWSINERQ